ncbi:unnamed protein product, partial [Cyprideis torosa]
TVDFDNYMQHDAHEFLIFLINHINEELQAESQSQSTSSKTLNHNHTRENSVGGAVGGVTSPSSPDVNGFNDELSRDPSWIHQVFQGVVTNEMKCLECETVSSKDETFCDIPIDVEPNTSVSYGLKQYSATYTLRQEEKFKCDVCCSYQEAQKRMILKKLPLIMTLTLKRFKVMENISRSIKVAHRVTFPTELHLFDPPEEGEEEEPLAVNPDMYYDLVAVVVHCGSGLNRGHYISLVKSHNLWLLFDDDIVEKIDPTALEDFYGVSPENNQKTSETGYILFYQCREPENS